MAWTYSGYMAQATDAARLGMARQFYGEVMDAITANVGADGKNRDSSHLVTLLDRVGKDITELEQKSGTESLAPGRLLADMRRS